MKRRPFLVQLAVAALTLSLFTGTGSAHHFAYLGEDTAFQDWRWSGVENYAFYWWSAASSSLWWWAESDLLANTQTAVNNWQSATGLPFYKAPSQATADLTVVEDNSLEAFGIVELTEVAADPGRNANYTYRALATIRNDGEKPVGGWQATIAHEIGHVIGLHEAYEDSGNEDEQDAFCNPQSTIMNSGSCANRPDKPSSLDISRVINLYQTGELLNLTTSSSWFTSSLYTTWKDGAWGEYEHRLYLYYWDGTQWAMLDHVGHTAQTGTREMNWNTRTLSRTFTRTQYGKPAGWYMVCGFPIFRHGGAGTWRCSNYSWVY